MSYQEIILDEDGYLLESDDGLFSTEGMWDDCLFDYFPLVESVFPSLINNRASEIKLNRVATTFEYLPGYYDFIFYREDDGIRWEIHDLTDDYSEYREEQQNRNEEALRREEDTQDADW